MSQHFDPPEDRKSDKKDSAPPGTSTISTGKILTVVSKGSTSESVPPAQSNLKLFYETAAGCNTVEAVADAIKILDADQSDNGKRYQELMASVKSIAVGTNRKIINLQLVNFLKNVFLTSLMDHGIDPGYLKVEFCLAGSLAKHYATPFSDIDSFLIFHDSINEDQKKQLRAVFNKIFGISNILFEKCRQFSMDGFGFSLHVLNGTVDELLIKIDEVSFCDMRLIALNAKSIYGEPELLYLLQNKIKENLNFKDEKGQDVPFFKHCFHLMINEFKGPDLTSELKTICLKEALIRPIDQLLQGLREKAKLPLQEFDDPELLLKELCDKKKMLTPAAKEKISSLLSEIYNVRLQQHKHKGGEDDEISCDSQIRNLLVAVGQLRASLAHYEKKKSKVFDLQPLCLSAGKTAKLPPPGKNLQTVYTKKAS